MAEAGPGGSADAPSLLGAAGPRLRTAADGLWNGQSASLVRLGAALLALCAVFALTADNFLTVDNFLNIGRATAVFGVAALGVTVALIAGPLDVSFGAVMSLSGIVAAERLLAGDELWVALALGLVVGLACGAVNGVLVAVLKLDGFIVTLGMLSVIGGYAFLRTNGAPTSAPGSGFAEIGRGTSWGVPNALWIMLALAVALGMLLRLTPFGQRCYAAGDNARAATLAGLRVWRVRIAALAISGATAAIAGMLLVANSGQANPGAGERVLLSTLAAVIIGGTALSGGKGRIAGTLLGIAILGTIDSGLNLWQLSTDWQDVIRGAIVVGALVLDQVRRRAV